jgi:hypothetical protein
MRLKDVIWAEKTVTDGGKWQFGVRMPPSAYPMSKKRGGAYRLGAKFTWRVILFSALSRDFRLLIGYRTDLQQYEATLGMIDGADTKVLASYEFHGTHAGWHVHAICGDVADIGIGFQRHPGQRRIPNAKSRHNDTVFDLDEAAALDRAVARFRLPDPGAVQWTLDV